MNSDTQPSPVQIARRGLLSEIAHTQVLLGPRDAPRDALLASLSIALKVINSARKNEAWKVVLRERIKAAAIKHRRSSPEILAVVKLFYPEHKSDDHFLYTGFLAYACFEDWTCSTMIEKFTASKMTMTEASRAGRGRATREGWPFLGLLSPARGGLEKKQA